MKLRFQLFRIMIAAFLRQKNFAFEDTSNLRFILMPWDCVLTSAGNDRYLAFMDIGRIDLAIRYGWWKAIVQNRWRPFVIAVHIRYNASLKMFQQFVLRTRIIYWDSRYIWLEHIFIQKGKVVATAISLNAMTRNNKIFSLGQIISSKSHTGKPAIDEDYLALFNAIQTYLSSIK